jgi:hypothetical protein
MRHEHQTWEDVLARHPWLVRWEGTGGASLTWAESGLRYCSNEALARATVSDYVNACHRRNFQPCWRIDRYTGREWVFVDASADLAEETDGAAN